MVVPDDKERLGVGDDLTPLLGDGELRDGEVSAAGLQLSHHPRPVVGRPGHQLTVRIAFQGPEAQPG